MSGVDVRMKAEEARRLKDDTAFQKFVQSIRDEQCRVFLASGAQDVVAREEAHAILRALTQIEATLDAALTAETFLDRKERR